MPAPELVDLLLEVLERVEGAVDAGEAQVGDLVELAERAQDGQAHLVAGHLRGAGRPDRVLNLLGQLLQLVLVHGAPLAGAPHAGDDLGPVERLAHPAALDDGEHRLLDGGEPATAAGARTAPPGGRALVGLPRVDDPAVGVVAERAPHGDPPPSGPRTRACPPPLLWTPLGTSGGSPGENVGIGCGRAYSSVTTRCRGTLGRAPLHVQEDRRTI